MYNTVTVLKLFVFNALYVLDLLSLLNSKFLYFSMFSIYMAVSRLFSYPDSWGQETNCPTKHNSPNSASGARKKTVRLRFSRLRRWRPREGHRPPPKHDFQNFKKKKNENKFPKFCSSYFFKK